MSIKDEIIGRGGPKQHRLEVEIEGGRVLVFLVPLNGVARVGFKRRLEEFIAKPNLVFVNKGLVPPGGFDEATGTCLYTLMEFNQEGWSHEDILEMFDANPDETISIAVKVSEAVAEAHDKAVTDDLETELKN